jgi:hypothetical protein
VKCRAIPHRVELGADDFEALLGDDQLLAVPCILELEYLELDHRDGVPGIEFLVLREDGAVALELRLHGIQLDAREHQLIAV